MEFGRQCIINMRNAPRHAAHHSWVRVTLHGSSCMDAGGQDKRGRKLRYLISSDESVAESREAAAAGVRELLLLCWRQSVDPARGPAGVGALLLEGC